eukprot:375266-Rhodomonas_salina.2
MLTAVALRPGEGYTGVPTFTIYTGGDLCEVPSPIPKPIPSPIPKVPSPVPKASLLVRKHAIGTLQFDGWQNPGDGKSLWSLSRPGVMSCTDAVWCQSDDQC